MTLSEKSAYLKGLMDGLNLNKETAEGKMIAAIVDLLGDVTKKLTDVEDTTIAISDELDEIEEDLDAIEDFIMDEEDDWDDDDEDYEDDFDDEYDEDEEFDDYADEKPARRQPRRASAPAPAPMPEPEEEDDNYGFGPVTTATAVAPAPASTATYSSPVLSVAKSASKQEVVLFRPGNFNDITKAADDLCANKAVVVNMEGVDKAMARRVVDFLSGSVYALQGTVTKIAQSAYLFCPHNMNVVGDLESLQAEVESYI